MIQVEGTPLVVGLGSNSDDRRFRITEAIEALMGRFARAKVSEVYETPALNGKDAPYVNAVLAGFTGMECAQVQNWLKELEAAAGRTAVDKLEGIVAIDLDLVIWDRRIIRPQDFDRSYFNIGYRQLLADGAFLYSV